MAYTISTFYADANSVSFIYGKKKRKTPNREDAQVPQKWKAINNSEEEEKIKKNIICDCDCEYSMDIEYFPIEKKEKNS